MRIPSSRSRPGAWTTRRHRKSTEIYRCSTARRRGNRPSTGIDINILDNPQEAAKALLTAEFVRKTKQYEPRVRVMRVEWTQNHARDGGIVPKVVVSFV